MDMNSIEADADDEAYMVRKPEDKNDGGEKEETSELEYMIASGYSTRNNDILGLGFYEDGMVIGLRRLQRQQ